jgi:hypothetical protein
MLKKSASGKDRDAGGRMVCLVCIVYLLVEADQPDEPNTPHQKSEPDQRGK